MDRTTLYKYETAEEEPEARRAFGCSRKCPTRQGTTTVAWCRAAAWEGVDGWRRHPEAESAGGRPKKSPKETRETKNVPRFQKESPWSSQSYLWSYKLQRKKEAQEWVPGRRPSCIWEAERVISEDGLGEMSSGSWRPEPADAGTDSQAGCADRKLRCKSSQDAAMTSSLKPGLGGNELSNTSFLVFHLISSQSQHFTQNNFIEREDTSIS